MVNTILIQRKSLTYCDGFTFCVKKLQLHNLAYNNDKCDRKGHRSRHVTARLFLEIMNFYWFIEFNANQAYFRYCLGTPRPSNLSTGVHSSDETIFIWNRPVNNCSDIEYRVSATNNCGSCSSIMVTPNNSITCRRILPEQQCNISVQSLTNCSTSEPETVSIIGKL